MAGMVMLASYPKSGNTWFRVFISNLLENRKVPLSINDINNNIASSRKMFDEITGVKASDLTHDEIDNIRPDVYRYIAQNSENTVFMKIHDAYTFLENGSPLIPSEGIKAIYIIRNPLDVAVSYSFHYNCSIDKAIKDMGSEDCCFCGTTKKLTSQLRQKLLTWSAHVESWVDNVEIPVHVIRYEDMKSNPFETFKNSTIFAGLSYSNEEIRKAINFSDFNILNKEEKKTGFNETTARKGLFFREGKTGGWRNYLSKEQADLIIKEHTSLMKRFGYLDNSGNILY